MTTYWLITNGRDHDAGPGLIKKENGIIWGLSRGIEFHDPWYRCARQDDPSGWPMEIEIREITPEEAMLFVFSGGE